MGIAEGIGNEKTGASIGVKVNHFRQQAQLRHCECTELKFEAIDPLGCLFDGTANRAWSFIALHISGNGP